MVFNVHVLCGMTVVVVVFYRLALTDNTILQTNYNTRVYVQKHWWYDNINSFDPPCVICLDRRSGFDVELFYFNHVPTVL